MRESWTDARLDDFRAETARRFGEVDRRFDSLERRMDVGFNRVDADLREMRVETTALRKEMNERFEALQRTLLQIGGGLIGALFAGFFGVILTQL